MRQLQQLLTCRDGGGRGGRGGGSLAQCYRWHWVWINKGGYEAAQVSNFFAHIPCTMDAAKNSCTFKRLLQLLLFCCV